MQEEEEAECDLSPIESEVCTENIDFGLEHTKKQADKTEEESKEVVESDKKLQHANKRENGWHKGILNDGLKQRGTKPKPPFLTMFRIMPSEGEIEKYSKLVKGAGFTGQCVQVAALAKRIEL